MVWALPGVLVGVRQLSPRGLQAWLRPQLPQVPPQPSSPHCLLVQLGVQVGTGVGVAVMVAEGEAVSVEVRVGAGVGEAVEARVGLGVGFLELGLLGAAETTEGIRLKNKKLKERRQRIITNLGLLTKTFY